MQTALSRASMSAALRATFTAVPSGGTSTHSALARDSSVHAEAVPTPAQAVQLLHSPLLAGDHGRALGKPRAICGIGVTSQLRCAHTDLRVPDFDRYRRPSSLDPTVPASETRVRRNMFSYMIAGSSVVTGAYVAKSTVVTFVEYMGAAADILAMSKIEINLADIPEGKNVVFSWRDTPLFVRHRSAKEIEQERSVNLAELRDPQHDSERVKEERWLVVIGVCTHLGCVPLSNAGDYGGYYCPCHGSHYDSSGRIRKGPAPTNLEVPYYEVQGDTLIVG